MNGGAELQPSTFEGVAADLNVTRDAVKRMNPRVWPRDYLDAYPELSTLNALMACTSTTALVQESINAGSSPLTFLAPSNQAWESYFSANSLGTNWQTALCDSSNGNNNRTAALLRAHVVAGVISTAAITANNNTAASLYPYAFYPSFQVQLLDLLGGNFTVKQLMPLTTQKFVKGRYDNAISGNAAVAHMITAVLALPQPFPPPLRRRRLQATRLEQTPPLCRGQYVPAIAYLNTPDVVATVLTPTSAAITNFLGRVSFGGVPMTFQDCTSPTGTAQVMAAKRAVCAAIVQFAILPGTQFFPSFDPADYSLTSGFGAPDTGARYALITNRTGYPTAPNPPATRIIYKMDTTPPVDAATLAFQTTSNPPCVGIARRLKGPIPAGVEAIDSGTPLTILAPTITAFTQGRYDTFLHIPPWWWFYYGGGMASIRAGLANMCDSSNGNNNRTAALLRAHVVSGVISTAAITANNNTAASLYPYAFYPSFQVQLLDLGGNFSVQQLSPVTSQSFVANRYDAAISGDLAVAHMIDGVLVEPQPFPPPPPPPPPPGNYPGGGGSEFSVYAGLLREPDAALYVELVDRYNISDLPYFPSGITTTHGLLNEWSCIFTVLTPTNAAVNDFLSRVTLGGRAMTFADCLTPTLPGHAAVCLAILQFAILPYYGYSAHQFLPSFDPAAYNVTSGLGVPDPGARYAIIDITATNPTQILYKMDTTPPVDAATLAFQTTSNPPCVGIARRLKGPIPAGAPYPNIDQRGTIYLIDKVLFPFEAYRDGILANGGSYTPAEGCPP
ncbi:hypothetical protein HYH02_003116 [Chlamydomonas schloesseri]|uniref:FAS1 domain-containing protein n=1 Tax=Chlamydomonas schloesseri TaxID=2026947 RepID=A0A835WQY7_9CHLO|nr:hypothetical protein HYH02_003116 [Chlamydomonas schloesseri]|eukprot:KAG2452080.1 hypothetical protein HYH02_003116 [Chlamydomonas schloesseri]